jgi:mannan endo-1,4-beta-mannosidase
MKMCNPIKAILNTLCSLVLFTALYFLSTGCHKSNGQPPASDTLVIINPPPPPPPPPPPASTIVRTDTLFGNGVDLQPSYYNGGNVTFGFSLMQQYPNIKSVRIEIEPSVPISQAMSWIQQAVSSGYRVIATYHKYTVLGSDNASDLTDGANWWKANYDSLSKAGPFTVNLMNEWGDHNLTASAYASDYNTAIGIVRQVYSGPIIIDIPGWGQETSIAAAAVLGTGGITKISDTNIILSTHIYPGNYNQAKGRASQSSDLDDLAAAGRPCIVGEFGNSPTGPTDWSGMVTHAKSLHWAVLGWSWNGDGGPMNMVTPAWDASADAASYSPSSYFTVIYSLL